jgi:hypothetical protein
MIAAHFRFTGTRGQPYSSQTARRCDCEYTIYCPELGCGDIGPITKRLDRSIGTLQLKLLLLNLVNIVSLIALSGSPRSFAAEQPSDAPAWLRAHFGEGEGQIAQVMLQRASALYLQEVSEGTVKNPCYFAMDATRPGGLGRRFYVSAISAGHGGGRNLKGIVSFSPRGCEAQELGVVAVGQQ